MRLLFVEDFLNILFPRNCQMCKRSLHEFEEQLCVTCEESLPKTNYPLRPKRNDLVQKVEGLTKVNSVISFLRFTKEGQSQQLIHEIKYKKKPALAKYLGNLLGRELLASGYELPELLIPVPLHSGKESRRGFNQSDEFAKGISEVINVPVSQCLIRTKFTETQTKKTRAQRLANVEGVFTVINADELVGKNVAIIDDVMTTGATLCACGNEVLDNDAKSVNFITIASGR